MKEKLIMDNEEILGQLKLIEENGHNLNEYAWIVLESLIEQVLSLSKEDIISQLKLIEENGKNLNEYAWTVLESLFENLENNY